MVKIENKILIGGYVTEEKAKALTVLSKAITNDKRTKTLPTHILVTSEQHDYYFLVSFDRLHIFKTKSPNVIKDMARHTLSYILTCFDANEENTKLFNNLLSILAVSIPPEGYYEQYGDEDREILKRDLEEGTTTKSHADGSPIFMRFYMAAEGITPLDKLVKKVSELSETTYKKILQNKAVNYLIATPRNAYDVIPGTDYSRASDGDGLEVQIETELQMLQSDAVTMRLLSHALELLCENLSGDNNTPQEINEARNAVFSVKDYAEKCGLKDLKEARRQIINGANYLYSINLKWVETKTEQRKKITATHNTRLFDGMGDQIVKNGTVYLCFAYNIAEYFSQNSQIAFLPDALYKINLKYNPHCFHIGYKLALHYSMNNDGVKENANRIKVSNVLKSTPTLRSYDDISTNDRHISAKIIKPFESALDALVDNKVLKYWQYCGPNGQPVTDRQAEQASYEEWAEQLIEFEFLNFPEKEQRRFQERAKKRKAKRLEEKKAKKISANKGKNLS